MSMSKLLRGIFRRPPAPGRAVDDAVFRSMVEQSGDVICHVVNDRFTYVSPSARAVFGWDPEAMIGTTGLELIHGPDLPVLQEVLARRTAGDEAGPIRHQLRVICGDGTLKWSETSARTGRSERGETHTALVIRDISDHKRLEEELEALAMKDGLTGLANRRRFDDVLERSWRHTLRTGGEMALLLLDVDHFKSFNDLHGHQAGDDCLRVIARTFDAFARRPFDLACRYGGEEFALIMGEIDPKSAAEIAEQICAAVAELRVPHGAVSGFSHVTVSIGVATAVARVGGSVRMPETLLQAADHALYKAKAAGRNRVERSVLIAPSGEA